MQPRSIRYFFLGYDSLTKAYRLFNPWTRKIVISKDVVFDEKVLGIKKTMQPNLIDQKMNIDLTIEDGVEPKIAPDVTLEVFLNPQPYIEQTIDIRDCTSTSVTSHHITSHRGGGVKIVYHGVNCRTDRLQITVD